MINYRFSLQPYSGGRSRFHCPSCNSKVKTFVKYIDNESGEYLGEHVGRCDRQNSCGYHYTPKRFFYENKISEPVLFYGKRTISEPSVPSYINPEYLTASLTHYEVNNFQRFLLSLFDNCTVNALVEKYHLGTSKYWNGASVFWQIDYNGMIRTGKIMLYEILSGKRVRTPFHHIQWVHKVVEQPKFNLKQCFFGEHLLRNTDLPVAIVESEKTALISSIYLPQFVWLAAGSLNGLRVETCQILKGRRGVLFPDLDGYDKWARQAKQVPTLSLFSVFDFVRHLPNASNLDTGFDLADYLMMFDPKCFLSPDLMIK